MVELRFVGHELRLEAVNLHKRRLDDADVGADGNAASGAGPEILRARQVIGVRVRLENPLHLQPVIRQVGQHPVGRRGLDAPRL